MRQINTGEMLALNKFLQMETNALAMSKAGVNVVGDEQLRTLTQSGISAAEARIKGLQQFIAENNVASSNGNSSRSVDTTLTTSGKVGDSNLENFPGGVV